MEQPFFDTEIRKRPGISDLRQKRIRTINRSRQYSREKRQIECAIEIIFLRRSFSLCNIEQIGKCRKSVKGNAYWKQIVVGFEKLYPCNLKTNVREKRKVFIIK